MPELPAPKLLDLVRRALPCATTARTEAAYCHWVKRFILFHDKRHPSQLGAPEVQRFLDHLAHETGVSASTQNQALAALLFLYNDVLALSLERHIKLARAATRACSGGADANRGAFPS